MITRWFVEFPLGCWLAAFLCSASLTGLACKLAHSLHLLDAPDGYRKRQQRPMPVMGGVAFTTSWLLVLLAAALAGVDWLGEPRILRYAGSLASSTILFCVVGVFDDRFGLRPLEKMLGQVLASLPFALSIPPIHTVTLLGWHITLGAAFVPALVLWLVACANMVNLMDGLDGLAGSIGVIALSSVGVLFAFQGQPGASAIAGLAVAAILGFLLWNWPPARIYMGDAGSLTIGFWVGAMSLQASSKVTTGLTLAVPLVILSVPVFDTLLAIIRRKLRGRSLSQGDREHIHHRLQDRGLSRVQALLTLNVLCLIMSGAAVTAACLNADWLGLALCGIVLGSLIHSQIIGNREVGLISRHVQALGIVLLNSSHVLKTRLWLAKFDEGFQQSEMEAVWRQTAWRVARMGGCLLTLNYIDAEGRALGQGLNWRLPDRVASARHTWQFTHQVQRSAGLFIPNSRRWPHRTL
ncbi:MAG: undecaprenyl-phosphate alpha-N-acetylglucosaminyl 1-phosphate transferase [Planctomycetaceae bacterium]|nr:MAG: undecaprenyl-phosphate alpha-N-acetylglucosaminyl 1-phosphate transferase [Planctomycetaceae bacterium]